MKSQVSSQRKLANLGHPASELDSEVVAVKSALRQESEIVAPMIRAMGVSRVKRWFFEFLYRSGLVHLFRHRQGDSVLVAMYHDVLPSGFPEGNPLFGMAVTVEEFDWQIAYFKKHYHPITFQQFADWYLRGGKLPSNPVLITFDDGHANNFRRALPVLEKYQVSAICFVLTGRMGECKLTWYEDAYWRLMFSVSGTWRLRNGETQNLQNPEDREAACGRFYSLCRTLPEPEQREELESLCEQLPVTDGENKFAERFQFLSREETAQLAERGIEIGAHTNDHPILAATELEKAGQEIRGSKEALEQITGRPVRAFAYPFGVPGPDFTPRDEALVRESGFSFAFASQGGLATRSSNQFALPRLAIGRLTRAQFAATVSGTTDSLKRFLGRGAVRPS